ncbi:sulfotransferase family 2 domain-containing protein [Shimia thalassica]|uniref:sulfotransferase family 2 domain-containing protein n=1 Tax=Shimia thalassica TaxID=1715693 RepID=UPI0026E20929|nr:sulfotransferase family 2 domain-containing protein [Shimia thalassica]MDO6478367.1 sulfotransferase family 2 domain-containing protein [Shimia thalassica]
MNFEKLLEHPVEKFAKHFRRRDPFVLFQHIPKTAGTSVTQAMREAFPPYYNIFTDGQPPVRGNDPMVDATERFLTAHDKTPFCSASGHLKPKHLKMIREHIPETRVFTFLREPVDRVISDYNYACSPTHPPHEAFIERYPTIQVYVESKGQQNKMWSFLIGEEYSEAAVEKIFRRYLFIGLVESLDEDFQFLSGLQGTPVALTKRANVTQATSEQEAEITPELRQRIAETNSADCALYEVVSKALADKRAEMTEFVKSGCKVRPNLRRA